MAAPSPSGSSPPWSRITPSPGEGRPSQPMRNAKPATTKAMIAVTLREASQNSASA